VAAFEITSVIITFKLTTPVTNNVSVALLVRPFNCFHHAAVGFQPRSAFGYIPGADRGITLTIPDLEQSNFQFTDFHDQSFPAGLLYLIQIFNQFFKTASF